jgi:hypothetical protein
MGRFERQGADYAFKLYEVVVRCYGMPSHTSFWPDPSASAWADMACLWLGCT